MRRLILSIIICLTGIYLIVAVWFLVQSYEDFTALVMRSLRQPEKLPQFHRLFTPGRFMWLKQLSVIAGLFFLFFTYAIYRNFRQISGFFIRIRKELNGLFKGFAQTFLLLNKTEKIALVVFYTVLLVSRVYFLLQYHLHIDEQFSYLYFVNKGLAVTMAYYPNPNNHVFYLVCCQFFRIFSDNPFFIIRLPSVIAGLLLPVVLFLAVRHWLGFVTAFLCICFLCFQPSVFYYSIAGRGYGMECFFVIIYTASLFKWIEKMGRFSLFFLISVIAGALGFYTLIAFLFPFAGINLVAFSVIVLKKKEKLPLFFFLNFCIFLLTFIFYLPVFLFSGWNALWGSSWVQPQDFSSYLQNFPAHFSEITGIFLENNLLSNYLIVSELIICAFFIFKKNTLSAEKITFFLILSVWLIIPLHLLLQRPVVYSRIYTYLCIFQALSGAVFFKKIFSFLPDRNLYLKMSSVILGLTFIFYNLFVFYNDHRKREFDFSDSTLFVSDLLYSRNAQKIFTNTYEYSLCLRFKYETSGRPIDLFTQKFGQEQNCNFLIYEKYGRLPDTTGFQRIYQDVGTIVYQKK
jgi:hypothetical protein